MCMPYGMFVGAGEAGDSGLQSIVGCLSSMSGCKRKLCYLFAELFRKLKSKPLVYALASSHRLWSHLVVEDELATCDEVPSVKARIRSVMRKGF